MMIGVVLFTSDCACLRRSVPRVSCSTAAAAAVLGNVLVGTMVETTAEICSEQPITTTLLMFRRPN